MNIKLCLWLLILVMLVSSSIDLSLYYQIKDKKDGISLELCNRLFGEGQWKVVKANTSIGWACTPINETEYHEVLYNKYIKDCAEGFTC